MLKERKLGKENPRIITSLSNSPKKCIKDFSPFHFPYPSQIQLLLHNRSSQGIPLTFSMYDFAARIRNRNISTLGIAGI